MRVRAHHLLCLLGFQGLGYNSEFVHRMEEIKTALEEGPAFPLKIVVGCDDICPACSYYQTGKCKKGKFSERRTRETDLKVIRALGLKKNQVVESSRVAPLVRKKIGTFPELVKICGQCGWREVCTYYLDLRTAWRRKSL